MKRLGPVIVLALVVFGAAGFGGFQLQQYRAWSQAYDAAQAAALMAYDRRDAGPHEFEVYRDSFDSRAAALRHANGDLASRWDRSDRVQRCFDSVVVYRRSAGRAIAPAEACAF